MTNLSPEQQNIERLRKLIEEYKGAQNATIKALEEELAMAVRAMEKKRVSEETEFQTPTSVGLKQTHT